MRHWEACTWAAGQTQAAVIRRVGELVARRVLGLARPGEKVLFLAGKGHNGDDTHAAEQHWRLHGRDSELLRVEDPVSSLAAVRTALAGGPALVVDGLFGIGLNRPLDAAWAALIEAVNQSTLPVLAVDVPSGLDADLGEPQGTCIQADLTLSLGAPKAGLLKASAVPFVGRLEVVPEIGLVPCPAEGELLWGLPSDFEAYPPRRPVSGHKGTFGHLALLAGSPGFHGAAVLAARAAQRAQPGLVSLWTMAPVYAPIASQLQAVMVHAWTPGAAWPEHISALLVGPGLAARVLPGELAAEISRWWREATVPVVVDASGLDWLPEGPIATGAGASAGTATRVITPHPGEAARLLRTSAAEVQADRVGAVRALSRRHGGCWVVLKGHQTIIGRTAGPLHVNPSGNPWLAQGGSGDVLAGYLAGLLAQPALQADPLLALRHAVWQHGAVADHLCATRRNWVVEDLVAAIGQISPRS
jgi:NAD(P)H-hydrate epimerase